MSNESERTDDIRKPEVIDIEAEPVEEAVNEPVFSREAETVDVKKKRNTLWPLAAGALVTGIVGGGVLYRELLASYFPTNEVTALSQRLDTFQNADKDLRDRLNGLNDTATQLKTDVGAMQAALEKLQQDQQGVGSQVSATTEKQVQLEQSLQRTSKSVDELKSSLATASPAPAPTTSTVDNEALVGLSQRVDTVEKDLEALKAQKSDAPDTTAISQTLSDLRAKVSGGMSYSAELDRIRRMVPAAEGLDVLAQHADTGLPDAKGLAVELKNAIPTLPSAQQAAAEDDSVWGSVAGVLSRIVTIRDTGESDWATRAAELVVLAEAGDMESAVKSIDAIDGTKPGAIQNFRDRAAARLNLDQAMTRASDAVTRHIAAKASGG